jgi:glycerol-3-phosphate O-acyltransferase
MDFLDKLKKYADQGIIPLKHAEIFRLFYSNYKQTVEHANTGFQQVTPLFCKLLELVKEQCINPFIFEPYHKHVREPFDYYQFGLNIAKPLIDRQSSSVIGWGNVEKIHRQILQGENVVLLANHQTELDPQIINCLLEEKYPKLATEMIFVAGGRVTSDPLAIPFSMGCNLLCIYSKKHIDHPPELKLQKQLHNQRTMKLMSQLLSEGSKCIYVAPSGGRDRPNARGEVEVAPFVAGSIEMFRLMALQAERKTHFYPLALDTYDLLPPPDNVEKELGENRSTTYAGVHLAFGDECFLNLERVATIQEKKLQRQKLADTIWGLVKADYDLLIQKKSQKL